MYIGGAEHSVLHLLYSRFLTMAFKDIGLVDFEEPYLIFRTHGLITRDGAKMSKSKGNVVDPDKYLDKFGVDVIRTYAQFLSPLSAGGDWHDEGIIGIVRFLNRVWALGERSETFSMKKEISSWLHGSIRKVTDDIPELKYNTAIAELMTALNRLEKEKEVSKYDFETFLLLLAPFAPFIAEELWEKLGNKYSIHSGPWPKYDKKYLVEDIVNLIVQVNGKLRATLEANKGITQKEAEKLALKNPAIKRHIGGKNIKKIVFVQDRLVNFVV